MKKSIFVVAATGLILSACATHHTHAIKVDPANPRVSIVEGKRIAVDQETISFAKGVQNFRINWQLPADSKYVFPKDGIVVKDGREEIVDCRPEKDGRSFSCLNKNTRPGKYKYNIKVEGTPAIPELDPVIVNG